MPGIKVTQLEAADKGRIEPITLRKPKRPTPPKERRGAPPRPPRVCYHRTGTGTCAFFGARFAFTSDDDPDPASAHSGKYYGHDGGLLVTTEDMRFRSFLRFLVADLSAAFAAFPIDDADKPGGPRHQARSPSDSAPKCKARPVDDGLWHTGGRSQLAIRFPLDRICFFASVGGTGWACHHSFIFKCRQSVSKIPRAVTTSIFSR